MSGRRVILRADGNVKIGFGHIYRMIALAEILRSDFNCVFAVNNPSSAIAKKVNETGCALISLSSSSVYKLPDQLDDADAIAFDLEGLIHSKDIVVTDGYLFNTEYQLSVKTKQAHLVCVDDFANSKFYADLIINHAPGIDKSKYLVDPNTRVLTGLNYAILRKAFFEPFNPSGRQGQVAFISLGGSDYHEFTTKVLAILLDIDHFDRINILCSNTFNETMLNDLRRKEKKSGKVLVHMDLNASELVTLLGKCTHAFVSASTVLIESYSRGLKCFAGFYSNNQRLMYEGFVRENKAIGLGNFNLLDHMAVTNALREEPSINVLQEPLKSDNNILESFKELTAISNKW